MESIDQLIDVLVRLRHPKTGCPWNQEQNFEKIAYYTLEEAYEVVDAVERKDYEDLCEELGDLLLQVVYHAQIASEQGLFKFEDVVQSIVDKMVHRHPHVFKGIEAGDNAELARRWDTDKAQMRKQRGQHRVFDGIARNLPPLRIAHKLQSRARHSGFDWKQPVDVLEKIDEEVLELRMAIANDDNIAEEIGDLLFTVVNLSRHFSINAEDALRKANRKFERRFNCIEEKLEAQGRNLNDASSEEMNDLWEEVKSDNL